MKKTMCIILVIVSVFVMGCSFTGCSIGEILGKTRLKTAQILDTTTEADNKLRYAIAWDDVQMAKEAIREGASPDGDNSVTTANHPPIFVAMDSSSVKIIKYLAGIISLDYRIRDDLTYLMVFCSAVPSSGRVADRTDFESAITLIKRGADVFEKSYEGKTPYDYTVEVIESIEFEKFDEVCIELLYLFKEKMGLKEFTPKINELLERYNKEHKTNYKY